MELTAKRYMGRIRSGKSKPVLVECVNNNVYVIKYMGNEVCDKVLANDFICSRLAKEVGVSVPEVEIVEIPATLIDIDRELKETGIKPGKQFGSYYYENSVVFTGANLLSKISNKDQIAKILAFDYWVGNDDRTDNLGNLLIATSKSDRKIIAIDYGNSFYGPDWIEDDLKIKDISIIPIDGKVYSWLFKEIKGIHCFDRICNDIESLDEKTIRDCIRSVPVEWGISRTQGELIVEYLVSRKGSLKDTMYYIVKDKLGLRR